MSMINGFQADNHIGFEFIHKDKCGVPTKAKVIEVDKDTGRVMLEYVHGVWKWLNQTSSKRHYFQRNKVMKEMDYGPSPKY
eukprot:1137990-Ditylum_brightwellii.AAC.1